MPIRARTKNRLITAPRRLRLAAIPVLQCSLAAGIAWWVATALVGHAQPFFAPIAAVVSLGLATGSKVRRSIELVAGVGVGIGVGDLLIVQVGAGVWQIMVAVALAMIVAVALDSGPVITTQAASSAVLVATLMPPGDGASLDRMVDAFVGGGVGLLIIALIPTHPLARARRDAATVLAATADALNKCVQGLTEQDPEVIRTALNRVRETQPTIDSLRMNLRGGFEVSRISPLYWRSKDELIAFAAAAEGIDNAVRNIRVLIRRSLSLVRDDEILDVRLIDEIDKLAFAVEVLREAMRGRSVQLAADPTRQSEAIRSLRIVARGARPELVAHAGLSAHAVFAQLRSAVVDLLQVAGMPRRSAIALLPPTAATPWLPPEAQP